MISTRHQIGTRAQLLRHLDGLESNPEVITARSVEKSQGNPSLSGSEIKLPEDAVLAQQLARVLGVLHFPYDSKIKEYFLIYADSKRHNTEAMLGLATLYLPAIELHLHESKLPPQLSFLPAALSTFNPNAVAQDGRVGLWQLNYQVAIRYGLVCDAQVDERRDPYKSTVAALAYLNDLYKMYKDWPLTLAAYTSGPAGISRARNRAGNNANFQALYAFLPANERESLWAFAAGAYIIQQANAIGLAALPMQEMPQLDHIPIQIPLKFAHVSKVLGIPETELRQMNPVCRTEIIPGLDFPVQLCLPQGYGSRFTELKDSIYKVQERAAAEVKVSPPAQNSVGTNAHAASAASSSTEIREYVVPTGYVPLKYTIKSGDNLGAIAHWYGLPLSELKAQNKLNSDRINANDQLVIYVPKADATRLGKLDQMSFEEKQASVGEKTVAPVAVPKVTPSNKPIPKNTAYSIYTVKSGDNLWAISQKYPGVSADDIMEFNGIGEALKPGMKLKIPNKKQ